MGIKVLPVSVMEYSEWGGRFYYLKKTANYFQFAFVYYMKYSTFV